MSEKSNQPMTGARFVPRRERFIRRTVVQEGGEQSLLIELPTGALKATVFFGVILLVGFVFYRGLTGIGISALGGLMVLAASALPGLLWITGVAKGYPIFPLFAFTYAYAFGIQILTNEKIQEAASTGLLMRSALVLSMYLFLATIIWLAIVAKPRRSGIELVRILDGRRAVGFLMLMMFGFATYAVASAAGWLGELYRYQSILNAFFFSFGALSTFALCFFIGKGELSRGQTTLSLFLLICGMMAISSGLLLIHTLGLWFLATIGFVLGSGRVPWRWILILLPVFVMLHYGKYEMREYHWKGDDERSSFRVRPWEYPVFYAQWFGKAFGYGKSKEGAEDLRPDLLERSSLLQLYVLIQEISPNPIPFMEGLTYREIPGLLIPRILAPDKPSVSLVNAQISIHYGLQTEESALFTSIGWGLFNEAYANYGYPGQFGLAIAVALFFGWATRFTMGYPIISARGLFAVLVMNMAFQSELSSPHFVTVLFQSTVALGVLALIAMRTEQMETRVEPMTVTEFVDRVAPAGLRERFVRRVRVR